jgi:hypothetical protein
LALVRRTTQLKMIRELGLRKSGGRQDLEGISIMPISIRDVGTVGDCEETIR